MKHSFVLQDFLKDVLYNYSTTYLTFTKLCRRKYEDQEFLKPNLRMKATSRTRSSSSTEPTSLNPSALSNRDSVNNNRDSVTSNSRSSRLNQGETPPGSFNNYSNSSSLASSGRSGGVSSRSSSSSSVMPS